jgi:hypothetical protein
MVGIEACASLNHGCRELQGRSVIAVPFNAAGLGKPYVKRQKNDMAALRAILRSVTE